MFPGAADGFGITCGDVTCVEVGLVYNKQTKDKPAKLAGEVRC